jgi:hypothetical protein
LRRPGAGAGSGVSGCRGSRRNRRRGARLEPRAQPLGRAQARYLSLASASLAV